MQVITRKKDLSATGAPTTAPTSTPTAPGFAGDATAAINALAAQVQRLAAAVERLVALNDRETSAPRAPSGADGGDA